MKDGHEILTVDGVTLRTKIVRKRVRNVNVRLVGDELRVSAPHRVPRAELYEIIDQLARRLVRRARADKINTDDAAVEVARRVASRFPDPPQVSGVRFVTNQRARWGSYSTRTGMVRLSAALRQLPSWVLEAVVAHELAHTFHADHSPAFWELLRGVCPKTDRARAFLEGVSWIAERWRDIPPVERSQLSRSDVGEENSEFGSRNSDPQIRKSDSQIRNSEFGIRKEEVPVDQSLPLEFE
jgi:predicted metal-dependent hydrolase